MKLYEVKETVKGQLKQAGIKEGDMESAIIIEYVTGCNLANFFLKRDEEATKEQMESIFDIVEKRKTHMPLQYILGEQEFMGLNFLVNENVLIPRQDTELLVEQALGKVKSGWKVLDLCTGSGCIGISIKKYFKDVDVTCVDISEKALQVAKENARKHQVEITFLQSDLYEKVEDRYDMIVSNPPYIESDVIPTLMEEVKDFEPILALDGDKDGLIFYRRLAKESFSYLKKNGMLLLEIGYNQGDAVSKLLKNNGYSQVKVKKDLCGFDRNVTAVWKDATVSSIG